MSPELKAKVPAEGVASRVSPLMPSLTESEPLIWVSLFTSKNLRAAVTARMSEEGLRFRANGMGGGSSGGINPHSLAFAGSITATATSANV